MGTLNALFGDREEREWDMRANIMSINMIFGANGLLHYIYKQSLYRPFYVKTI